MKRIGSSTLPILISGVVLAIGATSVVEANLPSVEAAGGPVRVHQMGGDIDIANAPEGATLHTMGGNIHLGSSTGDTTAETMGGNVEVGHAVGPLKAESMGGNVTVRSVRGPVKAESLAGDVSVGIAPGSQGTVKLSSLSGTVHLSVPRDFGMKLVIKLTYTQDHENRVKIVEPFGLTQSVTPDWDRSHGSPHKTITRQGQVGNGANKVELETINGDVIVDVRDGD